MPSASSTRQLQPFTPASARAANASAHRPAIMLATFGWV